VKGGEAKYLAEKRESKVISSMVQQRRESDGWRRPRNNCFAALLLLLELLSILDSPVSREHLLFLRTSLPPRWI
jgi:hypothetical protein